MSILVLFVAVAACLTTGLGGATFGRDLSNIVIVLTAVAAGVACLLSAVTRPGRMRWAWIGIGLGSLSYATGEALWTYHETFRGLDVPVPSVADAFYLGMVPLTAAGLLLVPVAQQSVANRVRSVVDGLMVAASLLLISWIFVLHPLLRTGSDSTLEMNVLLAYPVSDVILVTVVLYLLAMLRRGGQDWAPFMLIGTASVLLGLADSVFAYLSLDDSYASGGAVDVGWLAGFVLILLAARRPDIPATGEHSGATEDQQPFAMAVPYVAVLAALMVSVLQYALTGPDTFVTWTRSVLIVLIVGRQILTLLENRALQRRLEERVAGRTAELQARENRFRALVQQSSDSVAVIDADSTILYQSESVERIFGFPVEELLGIRLKDAVGRRTGAQLDAAIAAVLDRPLATIVVETLLPHSDGRRRLAEVTITNLLHDPTVNGLVLNTRDIHDAKELQDQLVHEAYHDTLTALASRALFQERLDAAIDDMAILFLDLDGFKEVNDSLGHAAGDQLLIQVADRLRDSVRDGDTVARFGGDEFAVLVESATAMDDAEAIALRIIAALAEPFPVGGRELHVGASIGIASADDAGDVQQLQRNADLAMYKAKAAGGSGFAVYDPAMHDELVERLELEADLRRALERDEFTLHYQPTVDLADGAITGFEALVRWRHPVRGIVSPLEFIGIAETTGLIVPLGRWVMAEACRQAVAWGAGTTRRLKMAVNVSVRQFDHHDLAELVAGVLAETRMPADQLCLEMTESVVLTETDENLAQLQRVKALGVTLAMDDFGTGYSSLAYLRRFPMDVLKIDRSFVDRLGGDDEDVALVRTIVRLGQSLGMQTVAEGIENAVQLRALREMACDFAQGYYLSKPLPAAEAGEILVTGIRTPIAA
ncbi:EAL domain-containing protein [Actinoplanes sp. NBRC 103695]|uniref:putative bifunctional diguanylate cyclase/phosphodiesterase n=1 Tax=Actinoplanes sp. NBRC 103695 TaxID=3032202 RepID=UPI002552A4E4|nr:EAL domain-containing protein [Actinoplanes sp. NBRC 103695]